MRDADDGDLPTWEQLVTGAGLGVGLRIRARRFGTVTPRHVRAWSGAGPDDGVPCLPHDWEARWAEIVRDLRAPTAADQRESRRALSWPQAWGWTAAATACATAASMLLR